MVRAGVLIVAFIAGVATAMLALYVALHAAPAVIMVDDMGDALAAAAEPSLSRFPGGSVIYVKSSLGENFLERLQSSHRSLKLMPFSARPENKGCNPDEDAIPVAPCERDDFIKLEVLAAPTPRTMLVTFATSNTFGQVLLLKFWGRWQVLVDRTNVI